MDFKAKQLHDLLWTQAITMARESPSAITSTFLQTLIDMIDIHAKRMAAIQNHVPLSIYLVLMFVSIFALFLVGHYFGTSGHRMRLLSVMLAILVVSVIWLIFDLDQPYRGTIRTDQHGIINLERDLGPRPLNPAK